MRLVWVNGWVLVRFSVFCDMYFLWEMAVNLPQTYFIMGYELDVKRTTISSTHQTQALHCYLYLTLACVVCSVVESILNAMKVLSPYWSCLAYQTPLQPGEECVYPAVMTDPPLYVPVSGLNNVKHMYMCSHVSFCLSTDPWKHIA